MSSPCAAEADPPASLRAWLPWASMLLLTCLPVLLISSAAAARSGSLEGGEGGESFCHRPLTARSLYRTPASIDLYNGMLWLGGSAAIELSATSATRWSRTNGFDDGIRDGLRAGSKSGRANARIASDVMLGVSLGLVPLASIGRTISDRECYEAFDMVTDAFESIALTSFVTQAIKLIAGRERPFAQECTGSPPSGSSCGSSDRKRSFFSGHASLAAAGAGLSCAFALKRQVWGESRAARFTPCALGAGAAITTGVLRIVADEHWTSDVLVGLLIGGAIGYFDTIGPFDLLRFEARSQELGLEMSGLVLPYTHEGAIGAQLALRF